MGKRERAKHRGTSTLVVVRHCPNFCAMKSHDAEGGVPRKIAWDERVKAGPSLALCLCPSHKDGPIKCILSPN